MLQAVVTPGQQQAGPAADELVQQGLEGPRRSQQAQQGLDAPRRSQRADALVCTMLLAASDSVLGRGWHAMEQEAGCLLRSERAPLAACSCLGRG